MKFGGQTLHLAMDITEGKGTFQSIEQGATLPIKSLDVSAGTVKADYGIATFDGRLDATGNEIAGTFHQGPYNIPLTFRKVDKIEGPKRPQHPQPPYPYASEEVSFPGRGGVTLAGTLTYPKSGGPFAAAVLLTGSGPQDRDETIMGHKPFLVLADHLTRAGFAVLRVDDRGTGKSTGNFGAATFDDKVADALAGVELLKGRKEIDPRRIGLVGHSEGGIIGPLAATRSKDIAFLVMLAGLGVKGEEVLRQQGIDIVRASGAPEAMVEKQVQTQAKVFETLRTEKDPAVLEKRLRELLTGIPGAEQQLRMITSPGFRDFLNYDPVPVLHELTCPVLAMDGTLDLQVSAKQNLPAIAAALAQGKSGNWSVVQLAGLNHLFQTAKTGQVAEYAQIEETFAPAALGTIADWLRRIVARERTN